jgi:hypothetical protein
MGRPAKAGKRHVWIRAPWISLTLIKTCHEVKDDYQSSDNYMACQLHIDNAQKDGNTRRGGQAVRVDILLFRPSFERRTEDTSAALPAKTAPAECQSHFQLIWRVEGYGGRSTITFHDTNE